MKISDLITNEILRMINESQDNIAEIQRNDFANDIGCVPSQINYVLSSRFTPEHGYIIESRRGGGGYIRIRRVV
ncbi:MAG: CtsR family transcriptional regulator, partial [Acutalibacteraceae bacterium]